MAAEARRHRRSLLLLVIWLAVPTTVAGADLLLVAYDGQQYYRGMRRALDAARHDRLDWRVLTASAARLDALGRGR